MSIIFHNSCYPVKQRMSKRMLLEQFLVATVPIALNLEVILLVGKIEKVRFLLNFSLIRFVYGKLMNYKR